MDLQERWAKNEKGHRKADQREPKDNRCFLTLDLKPFRS